MSSSRPSTSVKEACPSDPLRTRGFNSASLSAQPSREVLHGPQGYPSDYCHDQVPDVPQKSEMHETEGIPLGFAHITWKGSYPDGKHGSDPRPSDPHAQPLVRHALSVHLPTTVLQGFPVRGQKESEGK